MITLRVGPPVTGQLVGDQGTDQGTVALSDRPTGASPVCCWPNACSSPLECLVLSRFSNVPEVSMDGVRPRTMNFQSSLHGRGPPADDENGWVPRDDAGHPVVPGEPVLKSGRGGCSAPWTVA